MIRQILIVMAALLSASAHAADPGECGTPEAITAKLKTEDQHTIAFAQHLAPEKAIRGLLFTVNSDRSVGYVLQSNVRVGDKASKICVWERLEKVRLFDARKPVPQEAYLKASDEEALKACDELDRMGKVPRKSCTAFNKVIRHGDSWQHGVVLEGIATEKQVNGPFQMTGTMVTVQMKIGGKVTDDPKDPARAAGGVVYYSSFPEGATFMKAVVAEGEYTPYGLQAVSGK